MKIDAENIKPYDNGAAKTGQVEEMFDSIAHSYDTMNRLMTLGIDRSWRRKAVHLTAAVNPAKILDVATGTGDFAIQLARSIPGAHITGIDLSAGMMDVGRQKIEKAGLSERIDLRQGDCLALPWADGTFDAVTVAFGVRNFERLERGYAEMARVLRPGGLLCVVELAVPTKRWVRPFYRFYTKGITPLVGRLISSDSSAYTYLPTSIAAMPGPQSMLGLLTGAGLVDARLLPLTFGVCAIYTARKPG